MSGGVEDEDGRAARVRSLQEREIAVVHTLVDAEHALAREAVVVGRVLARAGLAFDPQTFIALRIVEGSVDGAVDAVDCLNLMLARGVIERSVAMTIEFLEDAA